MIRQYRSENVFHATEHVLFVPLPIESTGIMEGFAGQVLGRFALAQSRLDERRGLAAGEVVMIGRLAGERNWVPAYSLALCGIHRRAEHGWADAPENVHQSLDTIAQHDVYGSNLTVATAGIPGTGFSGLRGAANPEAIKQVLDAHALSITVYQDNVAGDRASLTSAQPVLPTGELAH